MHSGSIKRLIFGSDNIFPLNFLLSTSLSAANFLESTIQRFKLNTWNLMSFHELKREIGDFSQFPLIFFLFALFALFCAFFSICSYFLSLNCASVVNCPLFPSPYCEVTTRVQQTADRERDKRLPPTNGKRNTKDCDWQTCRTVRLVSLQSIEVTKRPIMVLVRIMVFAQWSCCRPCYVTFVWVTQSEHMKGANEEIKRPEETAFSQMEVWDGLYTSLIFICQSSHIFWAGIERCLGKDKNVLALYCLSVWDPASSNISKKWQKLGKRH